MVPACAGLSRRMDKLSVLRLAVQHIKTLKGTKGPKMDRRVNAECFFTGTYSFSGQEAYKPSYVSDEELKELISQVWQASPKEGQVGPCSIFQVSDGFMIGVTCDDMKIFYASDHVADVLGYSAVCTGCATKLSDSIMALSGRTLQSELPLPGA